jgi:hypothetical protein
MGGRGEDGGAGRKRKKEGRRKGDSPKTGQNRYLASSGTGFGPGGTTNLGFVYSDGFPSP